MKTIELIGDRNSKMTVFINQIHYIKEIEIGKCLIRFGKEESVSVNIEYTSFINQIKSL